MIRRCPHCGTKNRVPPARLADAGRCGSCHATLPALAEPLEVGADEFRTIVSAAKVPVLVDFWAEWCAPCRMAAPEVAKTAQTMSGRALILKVNTEEHPELASEFDVRSIPNFAILKNGATVARHAGLVDHRQMEAWLQEAG